MAREVWRSAALAALRAGWCSTVGIQARQPAFGPFDFGLCVPSCLLGTRLDIVVQDPLRLGEHLSGFGSRLRAPAQGRSRALKNKLTARGIPTPSRVVRDTDRNVA